MRALFCPLGGPGYVYPMVAVALELRRRGAEVAFATSQEFEPELERARLARIPRSDPDGPSFAVAAWHDPLATAIQEKHVERAIDTLRPDVVVAHQMTQGALMAAERRGLPCALLGFATGLWPAGPGDGAGDAADADDSPRARRLAWRYEGMRDIYNQARALFRLDPITAGPATTPMRGDALLLQSVPEFEIDPLPARTHLVGACLWEPDGADEELARALRPGRPALYVQQARTFDLPRFWPAVVQLCGDDGLLLVASTGRMDGPVGRLPAGAVVREHVPQGRVLPHARAVVCSGNSSAVLGALVHGVPMVLVPGGNEQLDLAEKCAAAGVAEVLAPEEATPEALRAAIGHVTSSPGVRAAVSALREAFARVPGPCRAADVVAGLAS